MLLDTVNYTAEPTLALFHASDKFVRGVMGPVGSGKSVASVMEMLHRALMQKPYNGVRRTRWAAIRNTYPELKSTTIKTFQDWIPPEICPIKYSSPIEARMQVEIGDGTTVDMEVFFLALDQPKDVAKLKSLELTGCWLNEASELPKAVLDMSTGRVGRYPSKRMGGPTWSGVIMDTNPPDDDHWYYKLAEEVRPDDFEFFKQPPALLKRGGEYIPNPEAENVKNQPLGYDYWLRMIHGKSEEWINVYILGQYGSVSEGKVMYPEYDDRRHVSAQPLKVYPDIPLILGWDFGLTPACAVCQVTPMGQLRVLREFVALDMGIKEFARDVVKPALINDYPNIPVLSFGDPAGKTRSETEETTCLKELKKVGIPTRPAPTQELIARREAVADFLLRTDRDGTPAFQLDPRCRVLRKGFRHGYKRERVQIAGEERYRDRPSKNIYSHIHEALQYAALSVSRPKVRRAGGRLKDDDRSIDSGGWT